MADLRIITSSAEPAELFAAYESFTARYERVCDDIDALDRRLRFTTNRAEGRRLTAELGALTEDSAKALGWVAAAFAAYVFASYGTAEQHADGPDTFTLTGPATMPRLAAWAGGAR